MVVVIVAVLVIATAAANPYNSRHCSVVQMMESHSGHPG